MSDAAVDRQTYLRNARKVDRRICMACTFITPNLPRAERRSVVPLTWRVSRGKLMMAYWGVMSAMFYVVTGAAVAAAVGTKQALIGIGRTIVVYGVVNKIISDAATENGLTVALFSRSMFGRVGASLATLIFAATAIYRSEEHT